MYDVIIIGSGASGAFLNHLLSSKKVLVIESTSSSLNKVKISGGGKANFTNLKDVDSFIEEIPVNKKSLYSLLNDFSNYDILDYFTNLGLVTEVRDIDKVFCKNSSKELINILLKDKNNILYNETVLEINGTEVITNKAKYTSKKIIIATGGISYPKTGSTGFIFDFCRKNNINTIKPYPVEASINLKNDTSNISGTSFQDVIISNKTNSFRNNLLFTHKGISGFSTLQLSEFVYLNDDKEIFIDFLPSFDESTLLSSLETFDKNKEIKTFLKKFFTSNFCEFFLNHINIEANTLIKQLNTRDKELVIKTMKNMCLEVISVQSVKESFVTGGGIDLKELNLQDLSIKKLPHIHVIGESLDLHGPIGGFNITLAFTTAYRVYKRIS